MNPDQQIESLISVASRLIDVMNREIEVLRNMRPGMIEQFQEEKNALATAYAEQVNALKANGQSLVLVAPALQQEFAEVAIRFERTLTANETALNAAREAHNRVFKAIVQAVQENAPAYKGYSGKGTVAQSPTKKQAGPVSMALDARF